MDLRHGVIHRVNQKILASRFVQLKVISLFTFCGRLLLTFQLYEFASFYIIYTAEMVQMETFRSARILADIQILKTNNGQHV